MWRSPCAVKVLTDAASANAAVASLTMSSRPLYRGGRSRGRRGFSGRPYDGGARDQVVSGDSHFRSVHEANLGFQRGDRGGRGGFSNFNKRPHPPPRFNHDPRFSQPPPPSDRGQPFRQPHFQPLDRRQPFHQPHPPPQHRPRPPKPLDYREWEYAKTAPPPGSKRFTILSYNILADYLAVNHRSQLYYHIPSYMLNWEWRKRSIMFELGLWSTDIMCFQEVDRFQDLEEELNHQGYSGIWQMRTGTAVDGCAIFWRMSRFKLVHEESIEFNKLGLRDNVAQICVLELVKPDANENKATSPTRSTVSDRVVICNIHVLYNPRRGEFKLGQVRTLLERAHAVSITWNNAPVVLCGDFNCTPKSPLYNFIVEQKLDLSGVDRDKISGQASAEIRASRPYNPNRGFQSANNSVQVPSSVDGGEVDLKTSNSLSDVETKNSRDSNEETVLSLNKPEPECSETLLVGFEVTSQLDQVSSNEHSHSNENREHESKECESSQDTHMAEDLSSVIKPGQEFLHAFNSEISPGEGFCQTSESDVVEESLPRLSTEVDYLLDETLDDLSLEESDEPNKGRSVSEDDRSILSAPHNSDSGQIVRSDQEFNNEVSNDFSPALDSETFNSQKTAYDPALWTPMEIATATGNADRTLMEHPLKLKSTYSEVEDLSNTRDTNGEPSVTSYNRRFMGTVDYIWHSEGLQTVRVLAPIPKHAMQWTPGFPTKKWGSDHIALVSELAFVQDQSDC